MFFLQYVAKHYKGEIQEKALGYAEKVANKNIRKIALAKAIRDNNIEKSVPYTKNLANDLYTNDPRLVKELSNKTDWTTDKSTTSILKNNPATYYSKKGTRVKLLGLVGQIGDFLSVFDLLSFAMQDELDFNSPIPLDFGPLSAAIELNTNKGIVQLVGKKKEEDSVAEYKGEDIVPTEDVGALNSTASVEAFAGAKAEASLSAALEWKNPDKKAPKFGLLASVGGSATGTAGAGIAGEFKIGFDTETGTFQVKMKAQATWGLGGGGAWSFTVGVQELYDFIVLVYTKLKEHDFNFIDIFENKYVKDTQDETESFIDVYKIYMAWVAELWKTENYFKAVGAFLIGPSATTAFSILKTFDNLIEMYEEYEDNSQEARYMIDNIHANSNMLTYVPPKVKGRMLYMITKYKIGAYSFNDFMFDTANFDDFVLIESAAKQVILSMGHAREWKEAMEHMAYRDDNKEYQYYNAATVTKEVKGIQRVKQSITFLRNNLLNDYNDWYDVCQHLTDPNKVIGWDMAWNKEIAKEIQKKKSEI